MRNKKGFTLIELLAVIVILAIIALIISPVITDIIKSSREKAAEESVNGYVSSANNAVAISLVDSTKGISITNEKYIFETGVDDYTLDKIEISGDIPGYSYLEFDTVNKVLKLGNFCMNGYNIDYINGKTSISSNNYCKYVDGISININKSDNKDIFPGDSLQLLATVDPSAKVPTWSSSNTSIATVDSNGLVTAVGVGTVTITAKVMSTKSSIDLIVRDLYKQYTDGTPIYYDVTTGKTCLSTETASSTGTKSGCMKFYAFGDTGNRSSTINVILNHNTTSSTRWADNVNTSGPCKESGCAYYQLLQDTSSWVGVKKQSNYTYTNSSTSYTVTYGDDNANARFITANEIATIVGYSGWTSYSSTNWFFLDSKTQSQVASSSNRSKYAWLYDYTNGCTGYGCNIEDNISGMYSYWTSDAGTENTTTAWRIDRSGGLYTQPVNDARFSVRPVVTILKDYLN